MAKKTRKPVNKSSIKRDDAILASSVGDKDMSHAYDASASGKLSDDYRSFSDSCDGAIPKSVLKDRWTHLNKLISKDEIARKMVSTPVVDALSNWRDVPYPWDGELRVRKVVIDACRFARTYGCSVVFPIILDSNGRIVSSSRSLESILGDDENYTIENIIHTEVNLSFDGEIESDFTKPWFNLPSQISIGDADVHPSRVAFFGNIVSPFFVSVKDDLADFHESLRRLGIAVRRNSGIVLKSDFAKIQNYIKARKDVGAPAPTLKEITKERAQALYDNINDNNVAVINGTESIEFYQQANIAQLIENVELNMLLLSGRSSLPMSKLFSKLQSSGMSNNSQTEFINYDQDLDSWRTDFVEDGLRQLDSIMNGVLGVDKVDWEWNPTKAEEFRLLACGIDQGEVDS